MSKDTGTDKGSPVSSLGCTGTLARQLMQDVEHAGTHPRKTVSARVRFYSSKISSNSRRLFSAPQGTASTGSAPNHPEHAGRRHIPDDQAGDKSTQSKKQLGGGFDCCVNGKKGIQDHHVDERLPHSPSVSHNPMANPASHNGCPACQEPSSSTICIYNSAKLESLGAFPWT